MGPLRLRMESLYPRNPRPGIQYCDCFRCPNHPGAAPFHGTDPDDEQDLVATADELGIPWFDTEDTQVLDDTGQAGQGGVPDNQYDVSADHYEVPADMGHARQLSQESN